MENDSIKTSNLKESVIFYIDESLPTCLNPLPGEFGDELKVIGGCRKVIVILKNNNEIHYNLESHNTIDKDSVIEFNNYKNDSIIKKTAFF